MIIIAGGMLCYYAIYDKRPWFVILKLLRGYKSCPVAIFLV